MGPDGELRAQTNRTAVAPPNGWSERKGAEVPIDGLAPLAKENPEVALGVRAEQGGS